MPSWAYLVILMFAGLLAWPAFEGKAMRLARRVRRRFRRGRYRTPGATRRSTAEDAPLAPPSRQ